MATRADLLTVEGRAKAMRERLDRAAATLDAQPWGRGVYLVTGGREDHWVNLSDPMVPACDCGDATWRPIPCKHVMAARLVECGGDVDAVLRRVGAGVN